MPFLSLLFGDVFALLSPWRAIGRGSGWVAKRFGGEDGLPEPLPYPKRLGRLPAAAVLFGFAICELCWARATEPGPLAVIMLVYLVVMLVGMSLYGVEPWVRNADGFGVLFSLIGSLSPLGRRNDAKFVARAPFTATARLAPVAGTAALLVVSIGSTAFDGAKEGALFNNLAKDLQSFFRDLGVAIGPALEFGFIVGLAGAVAIVAAIYTAGMYGMRLPEGMDRQDAGAGLLAHADPDRRRLPRRALLLAAGLQRPGPVAARDPTRSATARTSSARPTTGSTTASISATGIWYVQVFALVVGHVAALVLAHDRALELYGSRPRRDPLAGRHADPDGGLHLSGPVAVVGGAERMMLFAHAGHWAAQLLYLAPVLAMVGALLWARIRGKSGIDDEEDV